MSEESGCNNGKSLPQPWKMYLESQENCDSPFDNKSSFYIILLVKTVYLSKYKDYYNSTKSYVKHNTSVEYNTLILEIVEVTNSQLRKCRDRNKFRNE